MRFFPPHLHREHVEHLIKHKRLTLSGTGNRNAKAHFLAEIEQATIPEKLTAKQKGYNTFIYLLEDPKEAEKVAENLAFWSALPVLNLAQNDISQLSERERMMNLYRILNEDRHFVLIDPQSFLLPVPSPELIQKQSLCLSVGDHLDPLEIINTLLGNGYEFCADDYLQPGQYNKQGGMLNIFIPTLRSPLKIEANEDYISAIYEYNQESGIIARKLTEVVVVPLDCPKQTDHLISHLSDRTLIIDDELDLSQGFSEKIKESESSLSQPSLLSFTAFPEAEDKNYFYLYYLSLLKFQDVFDFLNDLREKQRANWKVIIASRHSKEIKELLTEENIQFSSETKPQQDVFLHLIDAQDIKYPFQSFQNPQLQIAMITDREIFDFRYIRRKANTVQRKVNLEFLQSLKPGDFVVHVDHGVGKFMGIEQQQFPARARQNFAPSEVNRPVSQMHTMTREYLKIQYAGNDKLYVPIDQAEKVNKYVGVGVVEPKLNRLGSQEWANVTKKVRKETQEIAKELLLLYSKREMAKGFACLPDDKEMQKFEDTFPYDETPGQLRAILDVKQDMESAKPMDRLVCGDVGFGKTEVAMRAAFKAVRSGKQVAVVTPITILTDQHFKEFTKRMKPFGIKVEMLSRFRTASEQKKIIKDLSEGKLDVVVGTHRLLQPDVIFKDLGLIIIDEEQRFGVKQKEALKKYRASVDILTLTATPIPRTLNMSLNKLRDITIISTPPPGRLPIITEVRRYSEVLIKDAVDREIARGGQVYFLHNRVQTIESMAVKLRALFPKRRIVVAHGKLKAQDLEQRIMAFKKGEYDILVSSTIIENGIDLPNANTLIVNNAEQFGLSQLYQLRGRIGRGKTQAYAYLLYHAQKLQPDAKRRLRAIVEATELGAGFQIAMHDLEIRGAGDVLGANQSGSISVVGVNHFVRLLQQTVAELKAGKSASKDLEDLEKISIDLPITAYIPDNYISESREKINVYQRISSATQVDDLKDLYQELEEDHGELPVEVRNLFKVLELKILARNADITALRTTPSTDDQLEIILVMGKNMQPEQIMKLLDANEKWVITGTSLKILLKDLGLDWVASLKESLEVMKQTQVKKSAELKKKRKKSPHKKSKKPLKSVLKPSDKNPQNKKKNKKNKTKDGNKNNKRPRVFKSAELR